MWKYVSRRIRDTFERSANYFDIRSSTGVASNANNNNRNATESKKSSAPCPWFCASKCWKSFHESTTNNKRWHFEHPHYNWLGAITWSSGLIIGWYASQVIHLKNKCKSSETNKRLVPDLSALLPYLKHIEGKQILGQTPTIKNAVGKIFPIVHTVSNEHGESIQRQRVHSNSSSSSGSNSIDLGDVLNSIENRLGLSAITNGQHQDGLNLLRSAANRHHAPALYNLALCYELGVGVKRDEKMAMGLYRSAAMLEHPGALYNLSIYYAQGRGGLNRNTDIAIRLLRLSAVKGYEKAIKALKDLDVPLIEEKTPVKWPDSNEPYTNDVEPSHSSFYVGNVQPFFACS